MTSPSIPPDLSNLARLAEAVIAADLAGDGHLTADASDAFQAACDPAPVLWLCERIADLEAAANPDAQFDQFGRLVPSDATARIRSLEAALAEALGAWEAWDDANGKNADSDRIAALRALAGES